jgi:hypothetical protein
MVPRHGSQVANAKISEEHSLLRYVPWGRLRKDADETVLGVLPGAFALRPGEEYLSATWIEYFAGNKPAQVALAVKAVRASNLTVKTKSGFAIGVVKEIVSGCECIKIRIRILHEEAPDNPAHAAVRRWPNDNDDLFALMADERWNELVLNKDIPA